MTDKEAYDLFVKYSGGEKGILMVREMIHLVGVSKAVENMVVSYSKSGQIINGDFKEWMTQAFTYLQDQMQKPNN
jgi:hypothetical protein